MTAIIWPSASIPRRPDSLGVQLFTRGGKATVRSLDVWQMGAIWPIE